jgi:type II secretion system protein N
MPSLGRRVAIALGGLTLTFVFALALFPYERYRGLLEQQAASALGARVQIGGFGPSLGWGGPVLRLRNVRVVFADGNRLALEDLRLRPALSTSWLRLDPALRIWAASPEGNGNGTLWLGAQPGFAGSLEALNLGALRMGSWVEGLELQGRADLELDLAQDAGGLEGNVALRARDGRIGVPPYGLPIPFESAEGLLDFDPQQGIRVASFALEDASLSLVAEGTIGLRPDLESGPLDLRAQLDVRDPGLRGVLGQAIDLEPQGSTKLQLRGSLSNPVVR